MTYYEIYTTTHGYEVWKWTNFGTNAQRFKVFKTKKGLDNWAKKQWLPVHWR